MRCFGALVVLFIIFVPSTVPIVTITVFDLNTKILEITKALLETFNGVKAFRHSVGDKKRRLFSNLDKIILQIDEINMSVDKTGEQESIINRMLRNIPDAIRLELKLHEIDMKQTYLNIYYKDMEKYIRNFDDYENETVTNFANRLVSDMSNSVPYMIEAIYQQVMKPDFFQLFLERFDITVNDYFCKEKQSIAQVLHNFMNEVLLTNMKAYILIQTAYMAKKLYKIENFRKEMEDADEEFHTRTNNIILTIKSYMTNASLELWRCDPTHHKKDETYIEITNFLHGIILNKVNLNSGGCQDECEKFKITKQIDCRHNEWCEQQTVCPKIVNCHYIDSSMAICPSKGMNKTNRRYDYVKFGNGRHFGDTNYCSSEPTRLETYRNWIIWKCSYCYCLCDEGTKFFSERYINMRLVQSNITDNKVVTGLRFVKNQKIIHMQVQEGKLLPHGQIDLDSVRWVLPEEYTVNDKEYLDSQDYYTIKWDQREFDLVDIMAKEGSVVTGVKFTKVRTRLHLQVQSTPFNFTTGKLKKLRSTFLSEPDIMIKHRFFKKELHLENVDVPSRSQFLSNKLTTNKYVKFTTTDDEKDAAQTTVPFFDAQPVESAIPVPLGGVGVFHKGRSGFGGFIAPRIFTYNFTKQLELVFSKNSNG